MERFDDRAKEEVRARVDIAAIIGRYVNLKASGQTLKGLCPFHKEKTPSFHVNPSRGFFHCFGCGKGGDVFAFLQEIESLSFPEVLRMLADETGVKLTTMTRDEPSTAPQGGDQRIPKTELLRIHDLAARFYYQKVREFPAAIDYFKSRGLAAETVREFRLGYAPPGWSSLLDYMTSQGVSRAALATCGLIVEKDGGGAYDRFRDRVIFPLYDLTGRVIAFAGRGMSSDAVPKYLNSPETPLYLKKGYLYGLHKARGATKEAGFVMVVEGYMDFLTPYQAGVGNIVATSGTAFTADHAHMISRFTSKVTLVFDGDSAGQNAARRAVFILAPFNLDISILVLDGDEDPDSFVRKNGGEAFLGLASKARAWTDFIIDKTIGEVGGSTAREKSDVIEQLAPLARSLSDPIAKARFKKEISERLGLQEGLVYQRLQSSKVRSEPSHAEGASRRDDESFLLTLEGSFIGLLLHNPDLIPKARQYVAPETLTDITASDIYSLVLEHYSENGSLDGVVDRVPNADIKRLISMILVKGTILDHVQEELVQKIVHLRAKYLRARIRQTRLEMKQEPNRRAQLLEQLKNYSTQLRELDERE